jgi:hypothetical protein
MTREGTVNSSKNSYIFLKFIVIIYTYLVTFLYLFNLAYCYLHIIHFCILRQHFLTCYKCRTIIQLCLISTCVCAYTYNAPQRFPMPEDLLGRTGKCSLYQGIRREQNYASGGHSFLRPGKRLLPDSVGEAWESKPGETQ